MDKTLRDKIKSMVLKSKEILEREITKILEGKYGIQKNGKIEEIDNLNKLSFEEISFREEIETKYSYLLRKGFKKEESFNKIIRETAYTLLNRLAALRFMDENDIIQESVRNGIQSKGFLLFKKTCPELISYTNLYLFYLELIYDNLSSEIPILFDRFQMESNINISVKVLEQIINLFNNEAIIQIWTQIETIGWIYQYFFINEKEKIRKSKAPKDLPQNAHQLIALNQFYTPDYVVRFLVDNSLGRYWKEMHPKSSINEFCKYLILNPSQILMKSTIKDIRNIKLLDPACGSSHFLLYAFDVFMYIYKEANKHNWINISENEKEYLPASIIQNNLYGIDIDKRAIQLANLSLFLKLKRINKDYYFPETNIVSADMILLSGNELNALKEELGNNKDINKFIDEIWKDLIHSDELGSILIIKNKIKLFIQKMIANTALVTIEDFLEVKKRPKSREFWRDFRNKLIIKLKEISSIKKSNKNEILKDEFKKSLDFLDLLIETYDIVVMNPPYGLPTQIGYDYLKAQYPSSNYNIFCAFIENWYKNLVENGILGTIVDSTFLVKSSYKKFRKDVILQKKCLFLGIDLGWDVLDNAQVATTSICLRKKESKKTLFINLNDFSNKELKLNELINDNEIDIDNPIVFLNNTEAYSKFPNNAIAYNILNSILNIFKELPPLDPEAGHACVGLQSSNAKRFQRFHWEVERIKIGKGKKWVPFANGGQFSPFFRPILEVVNWENDGYEIRNYRDSSGKVRSRPQNRGYYYQKGITWGKRGKYLNVSYLSSNNIFSNEGHSLFPKDLNDIWYIIGILNTNLMQYTINIYCGQHKLSGYVGLLPYQEDNNDYKKDIIAKAKKIYEIRQEWYKGEEISPNFQKHWFLQYTGQSLAKIIQNILEVLEFKENQTNKLQNEINKLVYDLYKIDKNDILTIEKELIDRPSTIVWDNVRNMSIKKKKIEFIQSFISYSMGVCLNKWNYSEFTSSEWDYIIVDDLGIKSDVIYLLQDFWMKIFNNSNIVVEIEAILENDLRSYLKSNFFAYHLKKYNKCPIFWQLTIPSKKYSIWINYLFLNKEYLLKIKNEIIEPKINFEEEKIKILIKDIKDAERDNEKSLIKRLSKKTSKIQNLIEELKEFHKNFTEIIDLDLPYDIDDGVTVNIAPFYKIIPWDEPKKIWDKFNKGKYKWSLLFKHLKKRGEV